MWLIGGLGDGGVEGRTCLLSQPLGSEHMSGTRHLLSLRPATAFLFLLVVVWCLVTGCDGRDVMTC
jgi:hypothetical protein